MKPLQPWVVRLGVVVFAGGLCIAGVRSRKFQERLGHEYERVMFQWFGDQIIQGESSQQEAVVRLLAAIHDRIRFPPPEKTIQDVEPLEIWAKGQGFCDQQANVLAQVVRTIPLDVRLSFLRDGRGTSPHSIAEVYLDGAWRIADPTLGVPILNHQGQLATREEVAEDPSLLTENSYVLALVAMGSTTDFAEIARWYQQTPIIFNTWRGKRKAWMDRCPRPLGRWIVYRIQDVSWFFLVLHYDPSRWQRELLHARHYAMASRMAEAERLYLRLIRFADEPQVREDAKFFLARLYKHQERRHEALIVLSELVHEHPGVGWSAYAELAIGQLHEALGHPDQALQAYRQSRLLQYDAIIAKSALALMHVK